MSLWRGPALATFRYEPFAQLEIARLEALRLEALEDRCELDIQVGDSSVVTELEALTAEYPFRERLTLLLMTALFRAGRQADALSAAHRLRHALREDLGVDPTPRWMRSSDASSTTTRASPRSRIRCPAVTGTRWPSEPNSRYQHQRHGATISPIRHSDCGAPAG